MDRELNDKGDITSSKNNIIYINQNHDDDMTVMTTYEKGRICKTTLKTMYVHEDGTKVGGTMPAELNYLRPYKALLT